MARPRNPILDRLEKKGQQSKAYRASAGLEKKLAKKTKGYRTAGSGNKKEKGDVRVRGVARIEHKATQAASFRVTKEMLEKIELAGRGCDEIPVMVVDFLDERGKTTGQEIACISLRDLLDLIDENATSRSNS
jgi:hypothetical protein